jgi:hypothetical protein
MALVQRLTHKKLEKSGTHTEVECTYSIVGDDVAGPMPSDRHVRLDDARESRHGEPDNSSRARSNPATQSFASEALLTQMTGQRL